MKAIMISIKPKYVAKILNGEKTLELRKSFPKDYHGWVYIYCTDDKNETCMFNGKKYVVQVGEYARYFKKNWKPQKHIFNGKVVAKFTLNKVDKHHILPTERILPFNWNVEQKLKDLCLTKEEVMAYGKGKDYQAFLWHISNLVIFDKPKELSEFIVCTEKNHKCNKPIAYPCIKCVYMNELTKAPTNWCYVEVEE